MPNRLVRLQNESNLEHIDRVIDEIVASELGINGGSICVSFTGNNSSCNGCRFQAEGVYESQCGVGQIRRLDKTLQNARIKSEKLKNYLEERK